MRPAEMRDAGTLTGVALGEVADIVRDVHRAVAGRVFGLLGTAAAPVRLMHDGIAAIAHTSTRVGVRALPAVAGATVAEFAPPSVDSVHATPRGHFLLNVLNGFWGDRLAAERPSLAAELAMRAHDGPLRRLPANVVHDVGPDASASLVVFVHGLCESDRFWLLGAERQYGDPHSTYGSRLRADAGWTPLYVSYNSGLHVSDNGRSCPPPSIASSPAGRYRSPGSPSLGTRWVASSCAAPRSSVTRQVRPGWVRCVTWSAWARRISARPSSEPSTPART